MHLSIATVSAYWDELEKIAAAAYGIGDLSEKAREDVAAVAGARAKPSAPRPVFANGKRLSASGAGDVAAVMGAKKPAVNIKAWLARLR